MFYLTQAGSALQAIQTTGAISVLTLPSGVTITSTTRGRFVVFNRQVFFINASTVNLWIDPSDPDLTVRPMNILPPLSAPTLAAGAGTGLTGAYRGAVAFYVKNNAGEIANLSPVPGLSITSPDLVDQNLAWTNIPISPDTTITGRRLYRTVAGGTALFRLMDIDDNVTTAILDNLPDATLETLPVDPDIGTPPGAVPGTALGLIVEWKNRLWAVSTRPDEVDDVRYTEEDAFYAWNPDNTLHAYPVGADSFGVTGFLRRRDFLGIAKRDRLLKVIGSTSDDLQLVIVAEGCGCIAPESCVVIRDKGYFLGLDGVYRWDDDGVVCISRATVDPWFTTDTYFTRSRFENAYARWNPLTNTYDLFLAALGSSQENRWISWHIDQQEWLGPHLTSAYSPNCAALLEDASDAYLAAVGGTDGYVYLANRTTPSDISGASATSAISAAFRTKWLNEESPDVEHLWGRLSVLSRIESSGTLVVTPYVGRLDASAGTTFSHDLTTGRQMLGRLGVGPLCSLEFSQAVAAKKFLLYGFEISPIFEVGRR